MVKLAQTLELVPWLPDEHDTAVNKSSNADTEMGLVELGGKSRWGGYGIRLPLFLSPIYLSMTDVSNAPVSG